MSRDAVSLGAPSADASGSSPDDASDRSPLPPVGRPARARPVRVIAVALASCIALLVVAGRLAGADGVPLTDLLRDPATTFDAPFHVGLVSNAGVLLWGACTAICLFTAAVASRTGGARPVAGGAPGARFFLAGAGTSAWLLLDDALLLHEQVFDDYLGLPGELSLGIGLGATIAFLVAFRRTIVAGDRAVLAAALVALGASAGMDALHDLDLLGPLVLHSDALETLLEDGLKLLGIVLWLTYFALTAFAALTRGTSLTGAPAARAS